MSILAIWITLGAMRSPRRPTCEVPDCRKYRVYRNTISPYCEMHKARVRRNGTFGLRDKSSHGLEKLPHSVDAFIHEHANEMFDRMIAGHLRNQGFAGATVWTVKYRRRKLGIQKYGLGGKRQYKQWIRQQALKKYGHRCELCGYHLLVETHHILPKHRGGLHDVDNLMVACSKVHPVKLDVFRPVIREAPATSQL